jgi:hypothetical protein
MKLEFVVQDEGSGMSEEKKTFVNVISEEQN